MSIPSQNRASSSQGEQPAYHSFLKPGAYYKALPLMRRVQEAFSQSRKILFPDPIDVPVDTMRRLADPSTAGEVQKMLKRVNSAYGSKELGNTIAAALTVSYYRRQYYRELENTASGHPLCQGALELYVDSVTAASSLTNRAVWVTSKDPKVANELNQFHESIGLEERIRDWAGQLAQFGDFFIELYGREGTGVAYIDDNIHPAEIERIDINGRLEGFIRTSRYTGQTFDAPLEAPWSIVHFKTPGLTRKMLNTALGVFGEPSLRYSSEMMNASGLGGQKSKITTRYGVALLSPAIETYKRLKMAEDSVMLARVTRGMLFMLYDIKMKGGTPQQASELLQMYMDALKRNTGLNMSTKEWKDAFEPVYAQVEDLYVATTDDIIITPTELGGKSADIKGIVDIDMLRSHLLGALRVSPQMLGIDNSGGIQMGEGSSRRVSINFAKNAKRLQDGVRCGIKRLDQIHLAYRGLNPRPDTFEVHFGEVSSAEEEELKNALKTGVEIVEAFVDTVDKVSDGNIEKVKLLDYLFGKIIKLDDFVLKDYLKTELAGTTAAALNNSAQLISDSKMSMVQSSDLFTLLPYSTDMRKALNESGVTTKGATMARRFVINETAQNNDDKFIEDGKIWVPKLFDFVRGDDNKNGEMEQGGVHEKRVLPETVETAVADATEQIMKQAGMTIGVAQ